jgi:ABC-type branched-subunit amino acid transport system substrate-binding protein/thioredoxin-like negative regulator of GroEL
MIRKSYFYLLLFFPLWSIAQTNADYQKKFAAGKKLISEAKYAQARETLRPLLKASPANAYVAYAHYYSALASLKNKQYAEARQSINTLLTTFPSWKAAEEVHYLSANIAFETADYAGALATLKTIRSSGLKSDVVGLKRHYLSQIRDINTLKKLQSSYADDAVVAEVLVAKLAATTPTKEDQALVERLQKQFKLNRPSKENDKPARKESYNVAVLFPFQVNQLTPGATARNNQFALDMYEGIKLGRDKLAEEGIKVNVFAYDVGNDANKALELVNSPELAAMDLLIGPLYAESNKVISSFSRSRQIALVNPISHNQRILQDNPYSFLVQTSPAVRGAQAAEYATKNFLPNTAMIFYGTSEDDSLMASAYRNKVIETGGKVLTYKKMYTPQFGTILQGLNSGSVGHVFLSSSNQSVATTLMSQLAVADSKVPVITNANLLDFQMIGYDQYERRNVHFIHPDYVDLDNEATKAFTSRYINENNIIPSIYSYQGYDLMVFFGQMLNKYGPRLRDEVIRQAPVKGAALSGFNYTNSTANQYVPLLKFEHSRLVPVNRLD